MEPLKRLSLGLKVTSPTRKSTRTTPAFNCTDLIAGLRLSETTHLALSRIPICGKRITTMGKPLQNWRIYFGSSPLNAKIVLFFLRAKLFNGPPPNKSLDRSHGQRVSHHHRSGAAAR